METSDGAIGAVKISAQIQINDIVLQFINLCSALDEKEVWHVTKILEGSMDDPNPVENITGMFIRAEKRRQA